MDRVGPHFFWEYIKIEMKIIKEMKSEIDKLLIYYFPRKNLGQVEVNFIRRFTTYINYTSGIL